MCGHKIGGYSVLTASLGVVSEMLSKDIGTLPGAVSLIFCWAATRLPFSKLAPDSPASQSYNALSKPVCAKFERFEHHSSGRQQAIMR
jgi:hypothetical protein